uniref:Polyprotein n=1 Tax=Suncus murinus associated picornavirus 3 TaxID=3139570 RepID=A0AB38ZKC9_9VIRU
MQTKYIQFKRQLIQTRNKNKYNKYIKEKETMEFEGTKYLVTPKYSNILNRPEKAYSPEWTKCATADLAILENKLKELGIVTPENEQYFNNWTKPLQIPPYFITYVYNDAQHSPLNRFSDDIGRDNLLHFLQSHQARRNFFRQHTYFHFSHDLFKVVFPLGCSANTNPRTIRQCPYSCRWFYQNCEWHENYIDEALMEERRNFKMMFRDEWRNPDFWHSLIMDTAVDYNIQNASTYTELVSKTREFLRKYEAKYPILEDVWREFRNLNMKAEAGLSFGIGTCIHCKLEFTEESDLMSHIKENHPETLLGRAANWLTYARDILTQQMETLMNVVSSANGMIPDWIKEHRTTIINIILSVVILCKASNWESAVAAIGIITNEIISKFSAVREAVENHLAPALKKVMSRFHAKAEAAPSAKADDIAANEQLLESVFGLFRDVLFRIGKVDAGLIKARVERIKIYAQVMNLFKDVSSFFLYFFQQLWKWIQIYFLGATEEELKEASKIVDSKDVEKWISDINNFEMKRTESGLTTGVPTLMSDKEAQKTVIELKQKGEKFISKLALNGLQKDAELSRLLHEYYKKVQSWYKIFESSLGDFASKHEPFVIYFHGDPGVGKTYIVKYVVQLLCAVSGKDFSEGKDIFSKSRDSQYFDGYIGQFCFLLDDFMQLCSEEGNLTELGFLIDAGSRTAQHLNMAELEKKSSTYFTSPLVILTSNTSLNPAQFNGKINSYAALSRRVDLKVEIRKRKGWNPNRHLTFDPSGLFFHCQKFNLDVDNPQGGEWRDFLNPMDWDMFSEMVALMFMHKQRNQDKLDQIQPLKAGVPERIRQLADTYINPLENQYEAAARYFQRNAIEDKCTEWAVYGENTRYSRTMATYTKTRSRAGSDSSTVLTKFTGGDNGPVDGVVIRRVTSMDAVCNSTTFAETSNTYKMDSIATPELEAQIPLDTSAVLDKVIEQQKESMSVAIEMVDKVLEASKLEEKYQEAEKRNDLIHMALADAYASSEENEEKDSKYSFMNQVTGKIEESSEYLSEPEPGIVEEVLYTPSVPDPKKTEQKAQAKVNVECKCNLQNLAIGHATKEGNNCLFDSLRQLVKKEFTPAQLRASLHARYQVLNQSCDKPGSDEKNPFKPNLLIWTDAFPFIADSLQVGICLHYKNDGKMCYEQYTPETTMSYPVAHIYHEGQHYSPMFVKTGPKMDDYVPATSIQKDPKEQMISCPAAQCYESFWGLNGPKELYRHFLDECRKDEDTSIRHQAATSVLETMIRQTPFKHVRLGKKELEGIQYIQKQQTSYAPLHSPIALHEAIVMNRWDIAEVINDYYYKYDYVSMMYSAVQTPKRWASSSYNSVCGWCANIVNKIWKPLADVTTVLAKAKAYFQQLLEKIKKWSIIGLLTLIGAGTIYAVGSKYMNKAKKFVKPEEEHKARQLEEKYKNEAENSEEIAQEEGYGLSDKSATVAKRKKKMIVETDYIPEITYSAWRDIFVMDVSYRLKRVDRNKAEIKILNENEGNNIKYTFMNRITGEAEEKTFAKKKATELTEWLSDKFAAVAEEKRKQFEGAAVTEGCRMDLVSELVLNLPVTEAAQDPSMMDVAMGLLPNIFVITNAHIGLTVRGFFIQNCIGAFPAHLLERRTLEEGVNVMVATSTIKNTSFRLTTANAMLVEDKDLVIANFSKLEGIKNAPSILRKFVKKEDEIAMTPGYAVVGHLGAGNVARHLFFKPLRSLEPVSRAAYTDTNSEDTIQIVSALQYYGTTGPGDCGSLIVREDKSSARKILGFHVAGNVGGGTASALTQEMLEQYLNEFNQSRAQAAYDLGFCKCDNAEEFFDCVNQIPSDDDNGEEFHDLPYVEYISDVKPNAVPFLPTKTKLMPSPLFNEVIETQSEPAPLRPFQTDEGKIDSYKIALSKLQSPQITFDSDLVDLVAERMCVDYGRQGLLIPYKPGSRGKLNMVEMIKGIEGDEWIRPLNMHTSPGYPYSMAGGKSLYVDFDEAKLKEPLQSAYERRKESAKKMIPLPAITIDTMKDERLPIEKTRKGKVRIFNPLPVDHTLIIREYFTRFNAQMMAKHVNGEVSVGINPHGEAWEALYRRMKSRGSKWLAGDYSAWDKRAPVQIAMAGLKVVEAYYRQFADYSEEDAKVRRLLMMQAFTAVHMSVRGKRGFLYRVHQCMPSGIAITAVYNSIINALLFRVIFAELAMEQGWSRVKAINAYKEHVTFVAYGDDHIARVSEVVENWFNMLSISRKMKEHGIVYTSATKNEVEEPFVPDEELQYLKRGFVKNGNRIDAPMKLNSILDILNWVQAGTETEARDASASAVRSVLIELSHHKQEVFTEWYKVILKACVKHGVNCDITTYDEVLQRRLTIKNSEVEDEWY